MAGNRRHDAARRGNSIGWQRDDAAARQRIGHDPDITLRFALPEALKIPEEEQLVSLDRAAERPTVLMFPEWLLRCGRPLHRIKLRIARELVQRSVEAIGAGARHRVQD
jgi:hypothetical protein